jgi:hypothetical protein
MAVAADESGNDGERPAVAPPTKNELLRRARALQKEVDALLAQAMEMP